MAMKGLGTLEQRAYLLLSLALGGLTAHGNPQRQRRAWKLWVAFTRKYPRFTSPLIAQRREPDDDGV